MLNPQIYMLSNQDSFQFAVDLSHLKRHFFRAADIRVIAHTISPELTHFCVCVLETGCKPVYWDARGGFTSKESMLGTRRLDDIESLEWDATTRQWEAAAMGDLPQLENPIEPESQNSASWQRAQQLSAVSSTPVSPDTSSWDKHLYFTQLVQETLMKMSERKNAMSM